MTAGVTPRRRATSDRVRPRSRSSWIASVRSSARRAIAERWYSISAVALRARAQGSSSGNVAVSDLLDGSPCSVTALSPGGRVRLLGQRPGVAQRSGQEVLITSVRHHTDLVCRSPASPLPSERRHVLLAVIHLVRRRLLVRVGLVVSEDRAPLRPPQQLSLVAARTTGERTCRIVQLWCRRGCHHSSLTRPRVKSGRAVTRPRAQASAAGRRYVPYATNGRLASGMVGAVASPPVGGDRRHGRRRRIRRHCRGERLE